MHVIQGFESVYKLLYKENLIFLKMICLLVTISTIERNVLALGTLFHTEQNWNQRPMKQKVDTLIMPRSYSYFQNIYSFFIISTKY